LNLIAGQVRGVAAMIEQDRRCVDVLILLTGSMQRLRGSRSPPAAPASPCAPAR